MSIIQDLLAVKQYEDQQKMADIGQMGNAVGMFLKARDMSVDQQLKKTQMQNILSEMTTREATSAADVEYKKSLSTLYGGMGGSGTATTSISELVPGREEAPSLNLESLGVAAGSSVESYDPRDMIMKPTLRNVRIGNTSVPRMINVATPKEAPDEKQSAAIQSALNTIQLLDSIGQQSKSKNVKTGPMEFRFDQNIPFNQKIMAARGTPEELTLKSDLTNVVSAYTSAQTGASRGFKEIGWLAAAMPSADLYNEGDTNQLELVTKRAKERMEINTRNMLISLEKSNKGLFGYRTDLDKLLEKYPLDKYPFSGTGEQQAQPIESEQQEKPSERLSALNALLDSKNLDKTFLDAHQFAGGIAGGALGALATKNPWGIAASSAVGGTLGRTIAKAEQKAFENFLENPKEGLKALLSASPLAMLSPALAPAAMLNAATSLLKADDMIDIGKEAFATGKTEALMAPLGPLGQKLGRGALGFLKERIGPAVAEWGQKVGWKAILDADNFKTEIPQKVARAAESFFSTLKGSTGKNIEKVLANSDVKISPYYIKNQVKAILPAGTGIEDFGDSAAKKKVLQSITDKVMALKDKAVSASDIWNVRMSVDDEIFSSRRIWSDDAYNYLMGIRRALNDPIKEVVPEAAGAFAQYGFVRNAEKELADKLVGIKAPNGKIYAQKVEEFTRNLFSGRKNENINLIKAVAALDGISEEGITNLLNYSAAQQLKGGATGMTLENIVSTLLGGKKFMAKTVNVLTNPATKAVGTAAGRAAVTSLTSGSRR